MKVENCSICGSPLTQFGNREAKDGILCRNCAQRLSPWLKDEQLKEMTITDVLNHLKYREENREQLENFHVTKSIGESTKILFDEDNQKLVVTHKDDLANENPDIISFDQITNEEIEVAPYLDSETNVDIFYCLDVESNEFKKVRFRVNEFPGMEKDGDVFQTTMQLANTYFEAIKSIIKEEPLIKYTEADFYD